MEISAGTIDITIDAFRSLLGEARFKTLTRTGSSHTFALWWHKLSSDVQRTKARGAFSMSPSSIFLLDLYAGLLDCSHDPELPKLLDRLLPRSQFYSTMFEALILSAYLHRGAPIRIVPSGRTKGKRTPDFVVDLDQPVHVECKSLQDPSRDELAVLEKIAQRLLKALRVARRSWRLILKPNRHLTGRDEDVLVREGHKLIEANFLGVQEIYAGVMCISEEVSDLNAHTDFSLVDLEPGAFPDHPNIVRIAFVEVDRYFASDDTDRIQSAIEESYGQLSKSGPNVLHIEIPYRHGSRWLQITDLAFNRTFGRLAKSYPRVSCLCLTGRFVNPRPTQGSFPLATHHALVPNAKARCPLPREFSVLGAEGQDPGFGEEGTIALEFNINEPLPSQTGRSLYNFSSHDGSRQLRLWQSFDNCFRADFVHPSFGRRTFQADLNSLTVGPFHRLALGFSKEGMSAAVNGEMLNASNESG